MNRMKIIPVKTPWMISPAYEIENYCGGIAFTNISLSCLNSKEQQNRTLNILNNLYNNNIPDEIWNKIGCIDIEIHFEPINYFGIYYPQQEMYGLSEEIYDTSLLKPYYDGTKDFDDTWNKKEFCPDPKMYEVENSILKKNLKIQNNEIKHWLITGHEEEIHILSKKFTWKEIVKP